MRLRHTIPVAACWVIGFGLLAGCTSSDSPDPAPTQVSPAPTKTSVPEPTSGPVRTDDPQVEDKALDALTAPEGIDPASWSRSKEAVRGFTLAVVTSAPSLSGQWSVQTIADELAPYSSDDLVSQILTLDASRPEDSYTLMSLSAVLTPSDTVTAPEGCSPDGMWQNCLVQDVVYANPSVVLDPSTNALKFTVSVDTARAVVSDGKEATSAIGYTMNVWVDPASGDVISVDNDFRFAPIVVNS